jgi:hypothetical protein
VAGALAHEEGADKRDEEHEIAGEGEEDSETVTGEELARAAAAVGAVIPVVAVASTAGRSAVEWGFSAYAGIFALNLNGVASKGGGHGDPLTIGIFGITVRSGYTNSANATEQLTPVSMRFPTADKSSFRSLQFHIRTDHG